MRWRRALLTLVLVAGAVLWLLPGVWVVVTSLKPTAHIVRLPPEWIPWPATLAHYGEVLFSSSRTARIGRAFLNSAVVSVGTVILVLFTSALTAYPLPGARRDLRDPRGESDDSECGRPRAPIHPDPAARLAQHLPGIDRAGSGDHVRVRRLPPAAVLPHAAGRARRRRAHRRRQSLAHLHADRSPAVATRAGGARDLRVPVGVERFPLAA